MKLKKDFRIARTVFLVVFVVLYLVGVTLNPNFSIHDFCMGLLTEIVGLVIALVIVEKYVVLRIALREEKQNKNQGKDNSGHSS